MSLSRCASFVLAALLLLAAPGCDDSRSKHLTEVTPTTQPGKPTTQELISGERVRTSLRNIPFWISVPKSWQVKVEGGIYMLSGPTPTGTVQIQIGRHGSPIPQHAERFIAGAQKEAAEHPGPYTLAEVRNLGGVQVVETRSVGSTRPRPAIDATGATIAETSTPMDWKVSAFVPNGKDMDICELYFVDFTREQYDRDKDLLQKILASLEYDPKISN